LGYRVVGDVPIARGTIFAPPPYAGRRWGPPPWERSVHGFRIDRVAGAHPRDATGKAGVDEAMAARRQRGEVGLAVLTRLEVTEARSSALGELRGDSTRRSAILASVVALSSPPARDPVLVLGTHLSHLRHGSMSQMARIRELIAEAKAGHRAVVIAGDMNLPGPWAQALLPGFRRLVRGRTWPGWSPLLQPDHVLVNPPATGSGEVVPVRGSDHLPVRVELSFG
ncbi:MAG: endonuclease/exonuclease/phosphatase family protein, partial [Acidimicrobiales bacterium]